MKQTISISFWLVALCTVCFAQTTKSDSNLPDFSGHWVSETVKQYSIVRPSQAGDPNLKFDLVIIQLGPELKVKESTDGKRGSFSRDLIYYLDGRGESNKGYTQGFVYDSKTSVNGKGILIDTTISMPQAKASANQTDEWQLSADGKTLTITT